MSTRFDPVPVSASVPVPDGLTNLQHDHALHTTDIPNPARHSEISGAGELSNSIRLPLPNLQNRSPAGSEKSRKIGEQPTNKIEAIIAAIEGRYRVMTNFDRRPFNIIRRHVGEVCNDQVPRRSDRGGKVSEK
jgi:hypothetical protein